MNVDWKTDTIAVLRSQIALLEQQLKDAQAQLLAETSAMRTFYQLRVDQAQAEGRRQGLEDARLAYGSHYAVTPGGIENCTDCGENWRSSIHLRATEDRNGRIRALLDSQNASPAQAEVKPVSEQCSCTTPHAAHTWGGRPMRFCGGVQMISRYCGMNEHRHCGGVLKFANADNTDDCFPCTCDCHAPAQAEVERLKGE